MRYVGSQVAEAIARKTDVGDWWILYMLSRNMDPIIYREMVTELAKKIETAHSNQWPPATVALVLRDPGGPASAPPLPP